MKLNKNSISAKLFRWFYSTRDLPTNLCPYFWKLVIAYVFTIPLFIISLPYVMIDKDSCNQSFRNRIWRGFFCWCILSVLIVALTPIMLFWHTPDKDSFLLTSIYVGFCVWVSVLVIGILYFFTYLREKVLERKRKKIYKERKENRSNIIVEMVKATYYKYCPKIDWN